MNQRRFLEKGSNTVPWVAFVWILFIWPLQRHWWIRRWFFHWFQHANTKITFLDQSFIDCFCCTSSFVLFVLIASVVALLLRLWLFGLNDNNKKSTIDNLVSLCFAIGGLPINYCYFIPVMGDPQAGLALMPYHAIAWYCFVGRVCLLLSLVHIHCAIAKVLFHACDTLSVSYTHLRAHETLR